ncbi:hypothetical protein C3L33_21267, partial [Rhododendron williamsianum]
MPPFVFLALLFLVVTASASTLITDFHALIELKNGFESPSPVLSTWNSSNPTSVCSWVGIKCLKGRVVSLDLTDMNLYGSVSPVSSVFLSLDKLTELSLAGNNFTGEIKIENLSSLRSLNISNNAFDGGLDWNYSSLENLEPGETEVLGFGRKLFHGENPGKLWESASLEYLSLAGNDLQGKIPGELGNLTNLREIYLGYYNVFEGGIPKEFGKLVNLVHMDISKCELDGPIPRELGNLNSLDTLFLHTNLLSGSIPKELGNLTGLVNLDLSINALTGEVPNELVSLQQLRLVNLFMNRLHGSIPDFFADFPRLETLQLWMNNFTGTIPENLGANRNLQALDLSTNKLTGTIPPNLCASNQLRILILLKISCSARFLRAWGNASASLEQFIRKRNSASVPAKLSELNLSNNFLSGSLRFRYRISPPPEPPARRKPILRSDSAFHRTTPSAKARP